MTETRLRCARQGQKTHTTHIYQPTQREYLEKQKWTELAGCRPFIVEVRVVGPWELIEEAAK